LGVQLLCLELLCVDLLGVQLGLLLCLELLGLRVLRCELLCLRLLGAELLCVQPLGLLLCLELRLLLGGRLSAGLWGLSRSCPWRRARILGHGVTFLVLSWHETGAVRLRHLVARHPCSVVVQVVTAAKYRLSGRARNGR
ncbi:MAG: hypothetical protein FWE61_05420, partial [Micrococcales bacterium]|nr:hypothetical protein [Micrococcales bacterium]